MHVTFIISWNLKKVGQLGPHNIRSNRYGPSDNPIQSSLWESDQWRVYVFGYTAKNLRQVYTEAGKLPCKLYILHVPNATLTNWPCRMARQARYRTWDTDAAGEDISVPVRNLLVELGHTRLAS